MSRKTLLLSSFSGILLCLSFPKADISVAAFFAFLPLFYAIRGVSAKDGFKAGVVAGFVCNVGVLYWVAYVVVKYGYLPLYVGIAAMLAVAAILSVYTGLFAGGLAYLSKKGLPIAVAAPLLWVCVEFGRSHLLTGFPWENLGYSQHQNLLLLQISDVTGVYGISFLVVFVNSVIYGLLNLKEKKRAIVIAEAATAVVTLGLVLSYGYYRVEKIRADLEKAPSGEVMVVQGNIDQSIKWDPAYQRETIDIYRKLTLDGRPSEGGLIVWPETATPFYFQDRGGYQREVVDIARLSGSYLLFGSPSYLVEGGRQHVLNSAFLLSPLGAVVGRYDKVHLVPFGEYVPLRSLFPFMGRIIVGMEDMLPGKGFHPLPLDEEKVGTLICYEAIFPEIAAEYRRLGVRLFVNITNDAWFGRTAAPYQHLSMVKLRAVENRAYIVRAANTGISAVIAPTGEVVARTGLFERTVLKGKIKWTDGMTFYSRFGDVFAYGCFAATAILFLRPIVRRKKNDRRNNGNPAGPEEENGRTERLSLS